MIFDTNEPIDDNLLNLVKNVKSFTKTTPHLQWVKARNTWILSLKDWIEFELCISYSFFQKEKYSIFMPEPDTSIGAFDTIKEVIDSLFFIQLSTKGVSYEIIKYLMVRTKAIPFKEAVNLISSETDLIISASDMEVLGIDTNQRGTIFGKKFGI